MTSNIKTIFARILIFIILEGLILSLGFFVLLLGGYSSSSLYSDLAISIGILAFSIPVFIFGAGVRKYALRFYIFLALGGSLVIGIRTFLEYLDDQVPVMAEIIYEDKFKPFSKNVAKLPGKSSLKLEKSLPVLDGVSSLYPLYSAFATAVYPEGDYPPDEKARYTHPVHFTRKGVDFTRLLDGRADILFMNGLSEAEMKKAKEKGVELVFTPIGKEALVFFVNKNNPVQGLALDEIKNIYSGRITMWKDLGGKGEEIKAYQREAWSDSQKALKDLMAGEFLLSAPSHSYTTFNEGTLWRTANYRNYKGAIGFSFKYFTRKMVQNDLIKLLEIDGVAPTEENVRDDSYPLVSTIYAITRKENSNPNVNRMLDWMISEEGQYLAGKAGYTPILQMDGL